MKYRQVRTKIWRDSYFNSLSPNGKLLFIYLFTNEQVNKVGLYELSDKFILFETGLSKKELNEYKSEFEKSGRIFFYKDWIYIKNFLKHNSFSPAPNVLYSFVDEFNSIPKEIKKYFFTKIPFYIPPHYKKVIELDKVTVTVMVKVKGVGGRVGGRVGSKTTDTPYEYSKIQVTDKDIEEVIEK